MSNNQFYPLTEEEENFSGNTLSLLFYYYSFLKRIIDNNRLVVAPEDLAKKLLRMLLNRDGELFLRYLEKNHAYTVNVAATQLGLSEKKIHSYTGVLVKTGYLCVAFSVRSGERGSPVNIYAINGEHDKYAKDAANLYSDLHATYKPEPLENYLMDYDYNMVAKEVIKHHLLEDGSASSYAVARILVKMNLDSDNHRNNVHRVLHMMGYKVTQG